MCRKDLVAMIMILVEVTVVLVLVEILVVVVMVVVGDSGREGDINSQDPKTPCIDWHNGILGCRQHPFRGQCWGKRRRMCPCFLSDAGQGGWTGSDGCSPGLESL